MLMWTIENKIDFTYYKYVKFSKEIQEKVNNLLESYDINFDVHNFKYLLDNAADYKDSSPDYSQEEIEENECDCGPEKDVCDIVGSFESIIELGRKGTGNEEPFYLIITEGHQDRGYKSPQYGYIHYLFFIGRENEIMDKINQIEKECWKK